MRVDRHEFKGALSEEDFRKEFIEYINSNFSLDKDGLYTKAGTQAAHHFGVSPGLITNIIKGRNRPNFDMLMAMGYERKKIVYYKRKKVEKKNI